MRMIVGGAALALALVVSGCEPRDTQPVSAEPTPTEAPATPAPAPAAAAGEAVVYDVACGCVLPEVKKCSEWALIDGKHVKIEHSLQETLGKMPFCGKQDAKARIVGTLEGEVLHASSIELVQQ